MLAKVFDGLANRLHPVARFLYDEGSNGFQWLEQAGREDYGRLANKMSLAASLPGDCQS